MKHYAIKKSLLLFILIFISFQVLQNKTLAQSNKITERFKDVPATHWSSTAVSWASKEGIVEGDGRGNFKPNDPVNQAEFIAMLIRTFPNEFNVEQSKTNWYAAYYDIAEQLGWQYLDYKPSTFTFTRAQVAVIMYNALESKKVSEFEAVEYVLENGLASGKSNGSFDDRGTLTRAEAVTFIYRIYNFVNNTRNGSLLGKTQVVKGKDTGRGKASAIQVKDSIEPSKATIQTTKLLGIKLGDTQKVLENKLGKAHRVLKTVSSYKWHVYNIDGKHVRYAILNNEVVGFFSNSLGVFNDSKYQIGVNTFSGLGGDKLGFLADEPVVIYESDYNITLGFSKVSGENILDWMSIIKNGTDRYVDMKQPTEEIYRDIALGIYDLNNSFRYKYGLTLPLEMEKNAQESAHQHAKYVVENYVPHEDISYLYTELDKRGVEYFVLEALTRYGGINSDIYQYSNFIMDDYTINFLFDRTFTHTAIGVNNKFLVSVFYFNLDDYENSSGIAPSLSF